MTWTRLSTALPKAQGAAPLTSEICASLLKIQRLQHGGVRAVWVLRHQDSVMPSGRTSGLWERNSDMPWSLCLFRLQWQNTIDWVAQAINIDFSQFREPGSPRLVSMVGLLVRALFLVYRQLPSYWQDGGESKHRASSLVSFCKGPDPILGGSTLMTLSKPNYLPKHPPHKYHHTGIRASASES